MSLLTKAMMGCVGFAMKGGHVKGTALNLLSKDLYSFEGEQCTATFLKAVTFFHIY